MPSEQAVELGDMDVVAMIYVGEATELALSE